MRLIVNTDPRMPASAGAAMLPPMVRDARSWSSRGTVNGQPGTQAIPAPVPAAIPLGGPRRDGSGDSRSSDAPPFWFPSIYYHQAQEHAPVSVFSDNQMPVPATAAPNYIKASVYVTRKGGQRQVFQPQVVPVWRGLRGTSYG